MKPWREEWTTHRSIVMANLDPAIRMDINSECRPIVIESWIPELFTKLSLGAYMLHPDVHARMLYAISSPMKHQGKYGSYGTSRSSYIARECGWKKGTRWCQILVDDDYAGSKLVVNLTWECAKTNPAPANGIWVGLVSFSLHRPFISTRRMFPSPALKWQLHILVPRV